jgi:hypothetical protein
MQVVLMKEEEVRIQEGHPIQPIPFLLLLQVVYAEAESDCSMLPSTLPLQQYFPPQERKRQ